MNSEISRRALLGTTAAAIGWNYAQSVRGETVSTEKSSFKEPAREIPYRDDCDVIVCGGGPAGVSAAIAAARSGARVRLFECHGCLGGIWTSGMLSYVIDADKPGFNRELVARIDSLDGYIENGVRKLGPSNYVYDVETMKYVLETLFSDEKISLQLHTRVVATHVDSSNKLTAIMTESKSGRQAWGAKVFIDATGDGDVGALAGCDWQFGRDKTCPCQPMSLMGVIAAPASVLEEYDTARDGKNKDRLRAVMQSAGVDPSYSKPTLWNFGQGVAAVMINHEYGVEPFDAIQVTEATVRARKELFNITRALRSLGGAWEGTRLVTTAEQIGIRDGRRIKGRYEVSVEDVASGARHEDAIARSTFSVDIHAASFEQNKKAAYSTQGVHAKPFDIPLRALIAADVDGLLLAGRCISGDFYAHASYRVTGNAVAMGEAAGVTAALSAAQQKMPHYLEWTDVSGGLQEIRGRANQNAQEIAAS